MLGYVKILCFIYGGVPNLSKKPREFLNRNWRRNPNMAPHLCTFVDNFNQISGYKYFFFTEKVVKLISFFHVISWVAHSVITPTTPKERSVIIKKLLKLIVVKPTIPSIG